MKIENQTGPEFSSIARELMGKYVLRGYYENDESLYVQGLDYLIKNDTADERLADFLYFLMDSFIDWDYYYENPEKSRFNSPIRNFVYAIGADWLEWFDNEVVNRSDHILEQRATDNIEQSWVQESFFDERGSLRTREEIERVLGASASGITGLEIDLSDLERQKIERLRKVEEARELIIDDLIKPLLDGESAKKRASTILLIAETKHFKDEVLKEALEWLMRNFDNYRNLNNQVFSELLRLKKWKQDPVLLPLYNRMIREKHRRGSMRRATELGTSAKVAQAVSSFWPFGKKK